MMDKQSEDILLQQVAFVVDFQKQLHTLAIELQALLNKEWGMSLYFAPTPQLEHAANELGRLLWCLYWEFLDGCTKEWRTKDTSIGQPPAIPTAQPKSRQSRRPKQSPSTPSPRKSSSARAAT